MRPADFDVNKLIEALQGTCTIIDDHLPDEMEWSDLTSEDHAEIDDQIFLCDQCGWWCEISEQNGEICEDCTPYDEDREEE